MDRMLMPHMFHPDTYRDTAAALVATAQPLDENMDGDCDLFGQIADSMSHNELAGVVYFLAFDKLAHCRRIRLMSDNPEGSICGDAEHLARILNDHADAEQSDMDEHGYD